MGALDVFHAFPSLSPGSSPPFWALLKKILLVFPKILSWIFFSSHIYSFLKCHPFWFLQVYPLDRWIPNLCPGPPWRSDPYLCKIHHRHLKPYVSLNPSPCRPLTHTPPTLYPVLQHHIRQASWARWLGPTFDSYSLISIERCPSTPEDFSLVAFLTLFLHPDLLCPSFILSGCVEWHSLSNLYLQIHIARIQ